MAKSEEITLNVKVDQKELDELLKVVEGLQEEYLREKYRVPRIGPTRDKDEIIAIAAEDILEGANVVIINGFVYNAPSEPKEIKTDNAVISNMTLYGELKLPERETSYDLTNIIYGRGNRFYSSREPYKAVEGEPNHQLEPIEPNCTCSPKCVYSCSCDCHNKPKKRGNEWL